MLIIFPLAVAAVGFVVWTIMYAFRSPEYDRARRHNPGHYPAPEDFKGCGCIALALVLLLIGALLR